MGTNLFVGNLNFETSEDTLRQIFETEGRTVVRVNIITDRETGRPRGFGFVEMGSDEEARACMEAIDGQSDWRFSEMYTIDRVAHDERPDELTDLPPRRTESEIHLVEFDA